MSIQLKGLDSLMKKLDDLTQIDVKNAVKSVEEEAIKGIRQGASFSKNGSKYIGNCGVREDKHYFYMDIGLKNDAVEFDKWKNLYFHEYGYQDKGWNFVENGPFISMHKLWFENAVNTLSPKLKKEIKSKLEKAVKETWNK